MKIDEKFLEILRCPACKSELELKPDGSAFKCTACRRVYAIRNDIPNFIVDQATIEEDEVDSG